MVEGNRTAPAAALAQPRGRCGLGASWLGHSLGTPRAPASTQVPTRVGEEDAWLGPVAGGQAGVQAGSQEGLLS